MKNSGAYGEIQSNINDRLIQASSSVASVVELHEHIHDNGIMRMREVEGGLPLRANQSMIMKPGRIPRYAHQPPRTLGGW